MVRTGATQTMKMFMDLSNTYENLKIICIGARSTAREVIEIDTEMSNRVAEIHVPLLSPTQLKEIIKKGNQLLNIQFFDSPTLENKIIYYSNSLASITHQLCFNYSYSNKIFKSKIKTAYIDESDINESIKEYLQQNSDTFDKVYSIATKQEGGKYENVIIIFNAMIKLNKECYTHNEILKEIHKTYPDYPSGNLSTYLKNLTLSKFEEIIYHDEDSGMFSFTNPFFKAYVMMKSRSFTSNDKTSSLHQYYDELIDILYKRIGEIQ
jgi:hypothetical protein